MERSASRGFSDAGDLATAGERRHGHRRKAGMALSALLLATVFLVAASVGRSTEAAQRDSGSTLRCRVSIADEVGRYDATLRTVTAGSPAHVRIVDERYRALEVEVARFEAMLPTATPGTPAHLHVIDELGCAVFALSLR